MLDNALDVPAEGFHAIEHRLKSVTVQAEHSGFGLSSRIHELR